MTQQVSPKEVLYARNGLTAATSKKLAAPPTPIQLSPTDPTDFSQHVLEGHTTLTAAPQKARG